MDEVSQEQQSFSAPEEDTGVGGRSLGRREKVREEMAG